MISKKVNLKELPAEAQHHTTSFGARQTFGTDYMAKPVPKFELPDDSMPANVAYQIIHDEMNLDGNPRLNVASFVTTWMEPEARQLMEESFNKNLVDQDEYPQTVEIQNRCVNMLARLYNVPDEHDAIGTATVGSSEAIHLAGLALKRKWQDRRKPAPGVRPNLIMGSEVQVCWEKFTRYFEVEEKLAYMTKDRYVIDVDEVVSLVDENTIGVVGILGTTFTGEYEPIKELNDALMALNEKTGWEVPIHVDAASGGFVAPFTRPELEWDFRLPLVKSINVSGHKYGLVYPGVGWVLWRDKDELPDDLIFNVDYLGSDQATFNLNFSRGANQIIAQYYNFLRLGKEGYRNIMKNLQRNAGYITEELEKSGRFDVLSKLGDLPVVAMSLKDASRFDVFHLADKVRESGWIVPAYHMAENAKDLALMRIVVREGMSRDMAEMLVSDLLKAIGKLEKHPPSKDAAEVEKTMREKRKQSRAHRMAKVC